MAAMPFSEGLALLERRTKAVSVAIWAVLALSLGTVLSDMLEVGRVIDFEGLELSSLSLVFGAIDLAYAVAFIISIVLVSLWIYRAHDNLRAAGAPDLEFSPGWSVGWFFIPIMNLFKPFQAMKELWNESHGTSNAYGAPSPSTVATWWAFWVSGNILGNISFRMTLAGADADGSLALVLSAISGLLLAAAAWFLRAIVREVVEGQRNHLQVQEAFS
ncbi:hypothetical protein SZ64_02045 [Erythrobacter sp. SG61-1L]|uniref:DUF4328 domain-containing protein n=1 Tax=Erythrobacter sp. SG61-1L TaxID=1603897 RepID=UPI0006C8EB78|nr:DUF4328 domain-containing protein [Erythrobacter sp. SG61-1L]KPL66980.1 hypothetical protein SZ64_02045 [Erythrobacter sp. SG61-1L]